MKFEDFDKKEFNYCNKMLKMKENEDITEITNELNPLPNKITMHKTVENQATVF